MSIEQYAPRAEISLASVQDAAVHRLGEWAQSADAAYQVAERLSQSSFVPAQYRGKPVELTAAILAGIEVGLSPMAAMRSFDMIQGVSAPRAITLRAVVQAHGHHLILIESTNTRCRMKGKRRDSDEWQTVTWTIERAQGLGLTSKDNWKKQPGAMLVARATSELARLVASDAILGIGYSSEEIADGGSYDQQIGADTTTPSNGNGTRKMSRTKTPVGPARASTNEDASEGPAPSEPADPSGGDVLKSPLGKAMFASLGEAGIPDAEQRQWISEAIGREIKSRKELTEDDCRKVLRAIDALPGDPS